MTDIMTFVIGLIICLAVAVLLTIVQLKMRKRAEQKKAQAEQTSAPEPHPSFIVGRIYQMRDGSLAKYIGDNKFVKVKMK